MNITTIIRDLRTPLVCIGGLALALLVPPATAGEIKSLAWADGMTTPTLQIAVDGDAPYQIETLEGGQWLRLTFRDTKFSGTPTDVEGRQYVKGVYPSMAADGTTATVDFLLDRPGQVRVEKAAHGYTAKINVGANATTEESASDETPTGPTANEIQDIVYAKLPGDRVQITLRMSQPPAEPSAFSVSNPARLALDFPGTRVSMANKTVNVREGAVSSITAVEVEGRTRIVVNLVKPVSYTAVMSKNNYIITLNSPSSVSGSTQPKTVRFASTRQGGKYSLKGVDFRRGPQADGKIIIKLSDPSVAVDIREQAGEVVIDFLNTTVSNDLQRRLDVIDFATPVQTIDLFTQGKNARMVITPKGRYEHIAYQTGDIFTVSIKPIIEKPDEKKVDEFGYSGEKLSLNFQNIEVRAALQVLADFTGLNFVVSDSVKGALTLRLKDVPWDQALDLIVDSKNLAVRRKGNVITVAPSAEVIAKEKASLEATKSTIELEPLVSELLQINYAKAEDIASLLKSIKPVTAGASLHPVFGTNSSGGVQAATESNTLLSPRGQVTVDARTNSLLIQDTPGKIIEVRKLIAKLDQPVRQVLIEARLVEARDNFARGLGVRWGHLSDGRVNNTRVTTSGNLEGIDTYLSTGGFPTAGGLNVNLATVGQGGRLPGVFAITLQAGSRLLDLELSALEQEGQGKIVSSPRIITANQKKAMIEQGQEQVFTTSVLGAGAVVTKKATLKLEVTPQITPDDRVNLEVIVTKDNFAASGLLNIKGINTTVLLDNGETVVIGGIYEQDKSDTNTQVPFFGDLPLLGWLFKNKEMQDNKTELLIFLTPRIVSENLTLK
jgi:type IV pilus assembly protein PilQ